MTDQNIILPTNPEDIKKLRDMVKEASNSLIRVEAERSHLNEIRQEAKKKFSLPPKQFNKMVKAYHKNTFKTEVQEAEDFDLLYRTVLGEQ